jgi:hypothetical protein
MIQHTQINKRNTTQKKSQEQNHTIISISGEKVFDKIQHSFMIKALKKLGIEEIYFNIITVI